MTLINPFLFFTDPIFRAPTIGSMLMCLTAGLVGALVFLRKQSLLGESLAHASYPGVILGVLGAGLASIHDTDHVLFSILILLGAASSALLGLLAIHFLEKKLKVPSDAALCFVLSAFFGVGLTLASEIQFSYTYLYQQVQVYLYGQAATMTDVHIFVYGILAVAAISAVILFYKELQTITFDRQFARSLGIRTRPLDAMVFTLVVLAVIIGIRSVGVVLMSAMLIAPPVAARQFTHRLPILFTLSALFGILSAFLGNYFSVVLSDFTGLSMPTGPMIVLISSSFCLLALFFSPERGLLLRLWRIARFRHECICENILKAFWRIGPQSPILVEQIAQYQSISQIHLKFLLRKMEQNGWLEKQIDGSYCLTADGQHRAAKIVRLHRLWEVYLADYLEIGVERVHRNAEEMEHIITPELERELTLLLNDPKQDPHHQPIPPKEITNVF